MNAELMRLLENILRQGVVEQMSADKKAVRVRSGRLLTTWIRWNVTRAGAFSIWLPPSIGEQVWIGCPGGNPENAFVIGSAYSADNPPRAAVCWKSASPHLMARACITTLPPMPERCPLPALKPRISRPKPASRWTRPRWNAQKNLKLALSN